MAGAGMMAENADFRAVVIAKARRKAFQARLKYTL
jgi:hypothetical protein